MRFNAARIDRRFFLSLIAARFFLLLPFLPDSNHFASLELRRRLNGKRNACFLHGRWFGRPVLPRPFGFACHPALDAFGDARGDGCRRSYGLCFH